MQKIGFCERYMLTTAVLNRTKTRLKYPNKSHPKKDIIDLSGMKFGMLTVVLKRKATLRECRYILNNLLGIDISTKEDFEFTEDYKEYNEELLNDVNDWLSGEMDEDCISKYAYDCMDDPLGMHNMLIITNYLQKKGII